MTGVEQLTNKIVEDARQQAADTKNHAEQEAQAIIDQARQRALVQSDKIKTEAKVRGAELRERLVSVAQLNARKEKLQVKQDLINSAFDQALERLCGLPDAEYFAVLADLIVKGSRTGTEQIVLSENDHQRLPKDFLEQVNKLVKENGLAGSLAIAKEFAPIKGGVILKQGDVSINYSFEALLKQNYDELAMEIAGLLFS
ncbi:MAG: hypothetical protein GX208_02340 [Firmicutes bacterium]|nr:hypothetical protein [Bacillota bacterium]